MTYQEAKEIVGKGPFISTYNRLGGARKRLQSLRENGPFASTEYHVTTARTSFDDIKAGEEPFKSGDHNVFVALVENYEEALGRIEDKVIEEYIRVAEACCLKIRNGMNIDINALASADLAYQAKFNSLAPHVYDQEITNEKGEVIGTETVDDTAKHAALALEEAESVWSASCCEWSK